MDHANVHLHDAPRLEAHPLASTPATDTVLRPESPDASRPDVGRCGAAIRAALAELGVPARCTVILETGLGASLVALEATRELVIYAEAPGTAEVLELEAGS